MGFNSEFKGLNTVKEVGILGYGMDSAGWAEDPVLRDF